MMKSGRVQPVRLERIKPNPAQPRRIFDPVGLQELADSIRQHGILQPLTVRKTACPLSGDTLKGRAAIAVRPLIYRP